MPNAFRPFLIVSATLFLCVVIAGCGGGRSSSSPSTESSGAESDAGFRTTKQNAKFLKFGQEATDEERQAANAVLGKNLSARETADFAAQCATLTRKAEKEIAEQASEGVTGGCPAALKELAEPLSSTRKVRKDTLGEPIAALRVRGKKGYALYHGNDGKDYAMEMGKEGDEWKVAGLLTREL